MKKIIGVYRNQNMHWVGDGFPVKNLFSYDRLGQAISPFLLLDYAAPYHFNPTTAQHGVGSHPHRGFETVTIAYQGEVSHKDSTGGGGQIKTGDVQWMTAGRGIVHSENIPFQIFSLYHKQIVIDRHKNRLFLSIFFQV